MRLPAFERAELATQVPQMWGFFQLWLPGLLAVDREKHPQSDFRDAERLAVLFTFAMALFMAWLTSSSTPIVAAVVAVPLMYALYEWSYRDGPTLG